MWFYPKLEAKKQKEHPLDDAFKTVIKDKKLQETKKSPNKKPRLDGPLASKKEYTKIFTEAFKQDQKTGLAPGTRIGYNIFPEGHFEYKDWNQNKGTKKMAHDDIQVQFSKSEAKRRELSKKTPREI